MQKLEKIYSGKAKSLYKTDNQEQLLMEFRDDATAFNAEKKASLARKGMVNNHFNAYFMEQLAKQGIQTHFLEKISETESLVKPLRMIPLECVVRNMAAGSICKRLGLEKGQSFAKPVFEFFYKKDELGDPLINRNHARMLELATEEQLNGLEKLSLQINEILQSIFAPQNLILVDFKLEFGLYGAQLTLGDEVTPDGCRIWDKETGESLDKDRFRYDMGQVIESYEIIAERLGIQIPQHS